MHHNWELKHKDCVGEIEVCTKCGLYSRKLRGKERYCWQHDTHTAPFLKEPNCNEKQLANLLI